ncbi:hypothetical protein LSTR_LSTR006705 [Laodelphax striatellus]|uniref:Uncharacterized protein n=1 Tax=Laodelphax striatellus TaxID=195883 RepID=A0A482X8X8_LAOST|nr:hypothetical protein LSTR_LSTR006705 [Laodelphax striatellus]
MTTTYRELLNELLRIESENRSAVNNPFLQVAVESSGCESKESDGEREEEQLLQGAIDSKKHDGENHGDKKQDGKKLDEQGEVACAFVNPEKKEDRKGLDPNHIFETSEMRDGEEDPEEKEIVYWMKRLMTDDYEEPQSPVKRYEIKRFTNSSEDFAFKVFVEERPQDAEPYDPNKLILPPNVTIYNGTRAYHRNESRLLSCFSCFKCLPCVKRERMRKRMHASGLRNENHRK